MRVLVAHASPHGSTASIARRIGARIGRGGAVADVRAAEGVGPLVGYDAVVIGSAIHGGAWLPAAAALAARCAIELPGRPLWLFSVSSVGDTSSVFGPRITQRMRRLRREPKQVTAWRAALPVVGHRNFAGVVQPTDWGRGGDLFISLLRGRYGDHRDWADVDAWADGIAAAAHAGAADVAMVSAPPVNR